MKNYSNSITVSVPTGAKGNFVGFVAYNKTTKQLTFWEDSGFVATEIAGAITVLAAIVDLIVQITEKEEGGQAK